jgi:hypothetical protein
LIFVVNYSYQIKQIAEIPGDYSNCVYQVVRRYNKEEATANGE